jgi:hypothetical protein
MNQRSLVWAMVVTLIFWACFMTFVAQLPSGIP